MFVIYLFICLVLLLNSTTFNNLLYVITVLQDWPIKGGQPLLKPVQSCDLFLTG